MTVILVDVRRPTLVPVEAVELLSQDTQYTEEMPIRIQWSLPSARSALVGPDAPVLLSSDPEHPAVKARLAAGERLIVPDRRAGERLVDAVEIMDRLRTSGPWESEQTHDSLRRYLLEETYELFDAVRGGNAEELRDELGDVLLQVLFHARIAEDAPENPFGIDDVADALVRKLGNRVPAVLAGQQVTLEDQLAQWEQRKALESKSKGGRFSCVDGLPTAQPALALVQKVIDRVTAAGLPADRIPAEMTAVSVIAGGDAENALRAIVLQFMEDVRLAEHSIAAARTGSPEAGGAVTVGDWRAHWPERVYYDPSGLPRSVVYWPEQESS
jgi:XTP/dITP diphosphohydrolase